MHILKSTGAITSYRPEPSYYAGIILRIIGYKFGKNNVGIIGCLQA